MPPGKMDRQQKKSEDTGNSKRTEY